MKFQYPALVTEENGSYLVKFPSFGWGATEGETLTEALTEAVDCLDELIATTMLEGETLPVAKEIKADGIYMIAPSALIAAKAALYQAQAETQIKKTELANLVGKNEKFIRTLLDPNAGSKIQSLEQVLHAMGKRLVLSVESIS